MDKKDREGYRKLVNALSKERSGLTVADMVAKTALPLQQVRELAPAAADEYSGRLEVTESGEIKYSFPRGFRSKYHSLSARIGRAAEKIGKAIGIAGKMFFKVWIMVMLIGYFVIFMALALASLVLSVAGSGSSSGSDSRSSGRGRGGIGGLYLASSIFNTIIRLWFYSELFKPAESGGMFGRREKKPKGKPLHKAIFSFVFGDGDPNALWEEHEKQAVIRYIQSKQGVISLPEFIALTGDTPSEGEGRITRYCAEFGGMPEATDDGTVVYRFDDLLLRSEAQKNAGTATLTAPLKKLRGFSSNPGKMNTAFILVNAVNLVFGGYFLYNAAVTGTILSQLQFDAASYLYKVTYVLLSHVVANPSDIAGIIAVALGFVPLAFSALFWLIPALRKIGLGKKNRTIKMENFRKRSFWKIWSSPASVKAGDMTFPGQESQPANVSAAQNQVIKEIGIYAQPEVSIDGAGNTLYSFAELQREKDALEKYRAAINPAAAQLGNTVFDSE
ncbi:hypothetical protein FACS1894151_00040 [Spirochaetia bacterium]|nr:hypothetical protein FACS1894151_00040 [Spirochaetia bacterium]